jgi:cysteine-rich repeat protein
MRRSATIATATLVTTALTASMLAVALLVPSPAAAYSQYSVDKDTGNCADCHGKFTDGNYDSLADGQNWPDGLHDTHRNDMLGGDCDVCHGSGSRSPVELASSVGGDGLPPISCVGCHGRLQDGTGNGTERYGAGLRQHHFRAGVSCIGCHPDSDPASFTTVGEDVLPPYYFDSGNGHLDIPADSCNPSPDFTEDFAGTTIGLDNDGDDDYDELDTDCSVGSPMCGNGVVDPGEECDDGNTNDGDCCSSTCQFEPMGSMCMDGVFCTVNNTCDGAGTCAGGEPRDCDDNEICTDDSCNEAMMRCDNIFDETNDPSCQLMCVDMDGDGWFPEGGACGTIDCDDNDPAINPGATEICDDNVDNNCNGMIDAADAACEFTGAPAVWAGPLDDSSYAGSAVCAGCHGGQFESWQNTLHSRLLIRPGDAQAAGFELPPFDPASGSEIQSWSEVLFVVGQKWKTLYVDDQGQVQGLRRNFDLGEWDSSGDDEGDYDCGACHTTGYDPDATYEDPPGNVVPGVVGSWVEYNIGCEACHGPGAEHAASPSSDNINRIVYDWYDPDNDGTPDPVDIRSSAVCGNCHYRNDHQQIQTDLENHEQHNDWLASAHSSTLEPTSISTYCGQCHSPGNADAEAAEHNFTYFDPSAATHVACISCHNPHATSDERWAVLEWPSGGQQDPKDFPAAISRYYGTDGNFRTSDHVAFGTGMTNELCTDCHKQQPGFRRHVDASPEAIILLMPPFNNGEPFPDDPDEITWHRDHIELGRADCVDCHMHYSRESANEGDIRSHTLLPNEVGLGGFALPHYSDTCGQCHSEAPDCAWCHGEFGGKQFERLLTDSPTDGSRRKRSGRRIMLRD